MMSEKPQFKHITVTSAPEADEVIYAGAVSREAASVPASQAASVGVAKVKADDYHETTLEDLHAEKTSTTQKVVIIAAVVLIVVAIIYCVGALG